MQKAPAHLTRMQSTVRRWVRSSANLSDIDCSKWIVRQRPLASAARVDVYSRGWRSRLSRYMGNEFPVLRKIMGEKKFSRTVLEYIRTHPSASYTIYDLPRKFPRFVKRRVRPPLMAEIALLEETISRSFFASDAVPLDIKRLSGMDIQSAESLVLRTTPATFILRSHYPLKNVWDKEIKLRRQKKSTFIVVYRQRFKVHVEQISSKEFTLLRKLRRGMRLLDLLKVTSHPMQSIEWLRRWAEKELIQVQI